MYDYVVNFVLRIMKSCYLGTVCNFKILYLHACENFVLAVWRGRYIVIGLLLGAGWLEDVEHVPGMLMLGLRVRQSRLEMWTQRQLS